MARSKRARRVGNSLADLLDALPEDFYTPELSHDLVGSLRAYLTDLTEWVEAQGVRPDKSRDTALQIMDSIGTSPAEWYRRWMETPTV